MRNLHNQRGNMDPLLVPLIIAVVMTIGLAVFGIWAYSNYLDNKNNVDQKIASAIADERQSITEELELQFAEREKQPLKSYDSPGYLGNVHIEYPKTWSAYILEKDSSSTPLTAYFHPEVLPDIQTSKLALKVTISNNRYDSVLKTYDKFVTNGSVKAKPVKNSGVTGTRLSGDFSKYSGMRLVFPIRDKTLEIWTELEKYQDDLTNIVLENLSFQP